MSWGIDGKVIIITGASSGIGEASALALARSGAKVVLGARNSTALHALAHRITDAGGDATYQVADVKRQQDLTDLVAHATEKYGKLDVLICNAGIMPVSPLHDLRVEQWEDMIDINIKCVLYRIAAALPLFREQGHGHFITLASTAAHAVLPTMAVYAATKRAVRVISEGLRQEAGDKLRVTVITPGMTRTNFAATITNPQVQTQLVQRRDTASLDPDAIAHAIAYAIQQPEDVDVSEIIVRPTARHRLLSQEGSDGCEHAARVNVPQR